ncbi:MAG: ATP-binding cassette domain-containing protein, partial [Pseudomonadota bacterium]
MDAATPAPRPQSGSASLQVEGITKRFGDNHVLRGIDLAAHERDVISVIGSSGSGKSTLLRCINFLEMPDEGRIVVGGEEIRINS